MSGQDVNSIEQLDRLLGEGKVSEEDYETLRTALRTTRATRKKQPGPTAADPVTEQRRASPRGFAVLLFAMWFVHTFFMIFIFPNFERVFAEMGSKLPGISILALTLHHSIIGKSVAGILSQIILLAIVVWVYTFLPRKSPARWLFWLGASVPFTALMIFYILALGLPFIRVGEVIR